MILRKCFFFCCFYADKRAYQRQLTCQSVFCGLSVITHTSWLTLLFHLRGNKAFISYRLQANLNFKRNSYFFFKVHLREYGGAFLACRPRLTLGRQSCKHVQRQETISIDLGFLFLCSHSRREGLFKITELVCEPLSAPTNYFVPVQFEGSFLVSYKCRRLYLSRCRLSRTGCLTLSDNSESTCPSVAQSTWPVLSHW